LREKTGLHRFQRKKPGGKGIAKIDLVLAEGKKVLKCGQGWVKRDLDLKVLAENTSPLEGVAGGSLHEVVSSRQK